MEEPEITEEELDLDFDEDLAKATYEVYAIDDCFCICLGSFTDAEEACAEADIDWYELVERATIPNYVDEVIISVEESVEVEGVSQPSGTIFKKTLSRKK